MPEHSKLTDIGYKYKGYLGDGKHVVLDPFGIPQVWKKNRDATISKGLRFKNTIIEFDHVATPLELAAIADQNGRGKRS